MTIEYYKAKLPGPKAKRLIEARLDIIDVHDGFDGGEILYKSIFFPSIEKELTFELDDELCTQFYCEVVYYKIGSDREEKYRIDSERI